MKHESMPINLYVKKSDEEHGEPCEFYYGNNQAFKEYPHHYIRADVAKPIITDEVLRHAISKLESCLFNPNYEASDKQKMKWMGKIKEALANGKTETNDTL